MAMSGGGRVIDGHSHSARWPAWKFLRFEGSCEATVYD